MRKSKLAGMWGDGRTTGLSNSVQCSYRLCDIRYRLDLANLGMCSIYSLADGETVTNPKPLFEGLDFWDRDLPVSQCNAIAAAANAQAAPLQAELETLREQSNDWQHTATVLRSDLE